MNPVKARTGDMRFGSETGLQRQTLQHALVARWCPPHDGAIQHDLDQSARKALDGAISHKCRFLCVRPVVAESANDAR